MGKNRVISLVAMVILLGVVLLFNNRELLFVSQEPETEGTDTSQLPEGKPKQTEDGWELTEGVYYIGETLPAGMYDLVTIKGAMSVNGKKLNENCRLQNYMAMPEYSLKIAGDGCVAMKEIEGKNLGLEKNEKGVMIKESGYYLASVVANDFAEKTKIRIYCKGIAETDFPIIVELQDTYEREVIQRIELLNSKEVFELEIDTTQSLYVDLGNETEDWSGCVVVEALE